jgi:hypothetical protein
MFELLSTFAGGLFDGLNYDKAIDDSVKLHDSEIEDLNISQLQVGQNSDGKSIGQYSSLEYKGRLTPVDLEKDGGFYKGINAKSKGGLLDIGSTDEKESILKREWGEKILGLTVDNMHETASIIIDDVADNLYRQITS